jgi:signal transduction histidine kinase
MKHFIPESKNLRSGIFFFWVLMAGCVAAAPPAVPDGDFPEATNIAALLRTANEKHGGICRFSLAGTVLGANNRSGMVFLQDDSGAAILETGLTGPFLVAGQSIRLQGTNYIVPTRLGVSLGSRPLVENDGEHAVTTSGAGTVDLKAGFYPIRVCWFNRKWDSALAVKYSGPAFGLEGIPDAVLFRLDPNRDLYVNGLDYRGYEGEWHQLPPFEKLKPVKAGVARNFATSYKTRNEDVGLVFDGMIQIKAAGTYTFQLQSDDGSRLFLNFPPPGLAVIGTNALPEPRRINIRQPLSGDSAPFWSETAGRITFLGAQQDGVEMELTAQDAPMHIKICGESGEVPDYLIGCQVRVRGVCLDTVSLGGYRVADVIVVPGWENVQVWEVPAEVWSKGKRLQINDCRLAESNKCVVRLRGKLVNPATGRGPLLQDSTGQVPVQLLNAFSVATNNDVDCVGVWDPENAGGILRDALCRKLPEAAEGDPLPLLTTAAEVQQLKRVEAQRGYPARIRGVVTWVAANRDCAVIQDSTRGVFVGLHPAWIWDPPVVGERLEITGKVAVGDFTPFVFLSGVKRLGMGMLPSPMHPTWDQLVGGSMDSQYVEITGLVTGVRGEQMDLLLPGGKITVEFHPNVDALAAYLNSVVRIRGVMFAKLNYPALQVTPAQPMWFGSATICVDTPPARDPFNAEKIGVKQLMQYDAQRNTFQRVSVTGQYLGARADTAYLTDNGFGLRFSLIQPEHFKPGDMVEVAGLVELGEASPKLREAVARKVGHQSLPEPQPLVFEPTNDVVYDSRLVWVEGLLVSVQMREGELALEMQTGLRHFIARLPAGIGNLWPVGSRLKLTGVYADASGSHPADQGLNAFELLVNSPGDVQLLARPPWWTLNRLLTMVGILTAGLALAFIWISLLRRQVERRSAQLQKEIGERQRAEQEKAIEQERSRIALDLHDDLGSRLTAISMLATANPGKLLTPEASKERLQLIADKARNTVTTLDGLVWAVDPKNDTVAALAEYLASFVEEYLVKTDIACQADLPADFPERTISAEARHNMLLAVREALNNAVRHARADQVRLEIKFLDSRLSVIIKDNGCGFNPAQAASGNGLFNLQARMRRINGECFVQSFPGRGTTVSLVLPLE